MTIHKVGIVTIGQSPRVDITADLAPCLLPNIELVEAGAMDPFTLEEIEARFYPEAGDTVLVSRMRDGRQAKMGEHKIMPYVQEAIQKLAGEGVSAVVLMCTGKFPAFHCPVPFITPYNLIHGVVGSTFPGAKIGVIAPDPDQIEQAARWWQEDGYSAAAVSLSPYIGSDIASAAAGLKDFAPDLVILDCLGYTTQMKNEVISVLPKAAILPRTLIARLLNELFGV